MLSHEEIKAIIPHREPFLFVDEILEVEYGKRAVGVIKHVADYQTSFEGHFPGFPIMPAALIIEALAEVGAVAALGMPENKGKIVFLAGADKWKFKRPILPGDRVLLEANLVEMRRSFGRGHLVARVGEEVAAEGYLLFAIKERSEV